MNTNFKGLFITINEDNDEELLPSYDDYTENEYIKLKRRVSVIFTMPSLSTDIN